MKRKVIAMLLAGTMLASVFAGCGNSESASTGTTESNGTETTTESEGSESASSEYADLTPEEQEALDAGLIALDGSLPIIKDKAAFEEKYGKLTMLTNKPADRTIPTAELAMVQKWTEDTGIEFDWMEVPDEGYIEKINLLLAGGDELPDAFWNLGGGRSGDTVVQYADQDVFLETEDIINNYMPNLKKILDDNPKYWSEITAPNGHTYGFPYIEEMYGLVLTGGPWMINKTWLDKVGKEVPTTVDEWVDCMKAFRDAGDLNGNGEADEIPMATWFGAHDTFGSYDMFYRFTGAFGCADSYCEGSAYADHLRMIDGKVTFTAMDEAFKKTAEFFNMLEKEDLIWTGSYEADASAAFTASLIKENIAKIGCFGVWTDQEVVNIDVHDEYVALPRLQGEAGMTGFVNNYSELQDPSDTAITTECKFPHVIAKFVDYMVGDPAISVTSNWGAEGWNYQKDENGILRTPLDENGNYVAQQDGFDNFGLARSNSTPARGSMIVLNEYYETVAGYAYDAVELLEMQKVNGKEDIMAEYEAVPKLMFESAEIQRLAQIQPTISDIVDRYVVDWTLNGVTDDSWEAYKTELTNAGVDELVSIYQTAVDRSK